jgi:hypothetical protein
MQVALSVEKHVGHSHKNKIIDGRLRERGTEWYPSRKKLVAVTGADGDLVTALGAAVVENGGACLGLHAAKEAVGLGAAAAVGLKGTLRHGTELLEFGRSLLPVFSLIAAIIDCNLSGGIFTAFVRRVDYAGIGRRGEMEYSEELQGLEERLLDPAVRKNPAELRKLLAEEFREIGASGTQYDREEIIAALERETPTQVELHDFSAMPLADDLVLVIYRTVRREERCVKEARRSSIWIRRGGRWQMRFHQGTRMSEKSSEEFSLQNERR